MAELSTPSGGAPEASPKIRRTALAAVAFFLTLLLTIVWYTPGFILMVDLKDYVGIRLAERSAEYLGRALAATLFVAFLPAAIAGLFSGALGIGCCRLLLRRVSYGPIAIASSGLAITYAALAPVLLPLANHFMIQSEVIGLIAGYGGVAALSQRALKNARGWTIGSLAGLIAVWAFAGMPIPMLRRVPLPPSTSIPTFEQVTGQHVDTTSPAVYWGEYSPYSTDMAPVDITLRSFHAAIQPMQVSLHLPRALIVRVPDLALRAGDQLPAAAMTGRLDLAILYPTGEPFTVAAKRQADASGDNAPIRELRALQASTEQRLLIHLTTKRTDPRGVERQDQIDALPIADEYDGLAHLKGGETDFYLGQEGTDLFSLISCNGAARFCTAAVSIGSDLDAEVEVPNFRAHGGRRYANETARIVKDVVCSAVAGGCR